MSVERRDWEASGRCRTTPEPLVPNLFPEDGAGVKVAKEFCRPCPVKANCLESALQRTDQFGVLGGTSERERRKMLKERNSKS